MERAYDVLADDEPDEDLGLLAAAARERLLVRRRLRARAASGIERAIEIGGVARRCEALLAGASYAGAIIALTRGRTQERFALLRQARESRSSTTSSATRVDLLQPLRPLSSSATGYEEALAYLERRLRSRAGAATASGEWATLAEMTIRSCMLGRWDEALAAAAEIPEDQLQDTITLSLLSSVVEIQIARGAPRGRRAASSLYPETSADVQERTRSPPRGLRFSTAKGAWQRRSTPDSPRSRRMPGRVESELSYQQSKQAFVHAIEAALALGRREQAEELLARVEALPRGYRPPYLDAHAHRFRARLEGDVAGYVTAAERFRELAMPFWVAVTDLEHAERLGVGEEAERLRPKPARSSHAYRRRRGSTAPPLPSEEVAGCPAPAAARRTPRAGSSAPTAARRSRPPALVRRRLDAPAERFCGECGTPLTAAPAPAPSAPGRTGGRAPPRLGAVRRPRRLHDGVGEPRRRGDARAALALLRDRRSG